MTETHIPYGIEQFQRFAPRIQLLPNHSPLRPEDIRIFPFLLHQEDALQIYYCPFEYVNEAAKVVLIGITPGWTQMEIAYRTARDYLLQGMPYPEVLKCVNREASFAGTMRSNLTTMLDDLLLPSLLGVRSSIILFSRDSNLIHTTSAIRYPIFINGKNYSGFSPDLRTKPVLLRYVKEVLAMELSQVDKAIIVPLGKAASIACETLISESLLSADRCLLGFPHPSGANGHRKAHFDQIKPALRLKLDGWFGKA